MSVQVLIESRKSIASAEVAVWIDQWVFALQLERSDSNPNTILTVKGARYQEITQRFRPIESIRISMSAYHLAVLFEFGRETTLPERRLLGAALAGKLEPIEQALMDSVENIKQHSKSATTS